MDQLKVALAWLKKHHFWVLALVVVGAVTGVWYTGSASVASATTSAKTTIENEFNKIQGHQQAAFKPNDNINRSQREEAVKQAENVLAEWNKLYQVQKETVLIWPEELSERFIRAVQNDRFGDPIANTLRNLYQNYISEAFPSLLEIVDARPMPTDGTGGAVMSRGMMGGEYGGEYGGGPQDPSLAEDQEDYLVEWLDQGALRSRLDLKATPSAIQVWVLQEDLWVYRSVLGAIADTNAATGASRRERAAVQTIIELKVGQAAGGSTPEEQRIIAPEKEEVATSGFGGGFGGEFGGMGGMSGEYGGMGGMGGEYGGMGGMGGMGGEYGGMGGMGGMGGEYGGMGGEAGAAEGADAATVLLTGRYLDDAGQPIQSVTPGDYSFGREFKRLPVRMVLEMDTRWLPELMWELANAPLQVEVEQVRFNPGKEGQSSASMRGGPNDAAAFDRRPTVGTVIVHGIVYIFNQPDAAIVQFDGAE